MLAGVQLGGEAAERRRRQTDESERRLEGLQLVVQLAAADNKDGQQCGGSSRGRRRREQLPSATKVGDGRVRE